MRRSATTLAVLVVSMACATNDGRSSAAARDTIAAARDTITPAVRETAAPAVVTRADTTTPAPRVTGGPQRPRPEPRASGCGGSFVNVIVTQSALEGTTLSRVAEELTASVEGVVGAPSLSPAIRAFRVQVTDSSRAARLVERLRGSSRVESVERDQCGVRVH
ncbi:MAG TPA: hypothetical protein VFI52_03675 [Gemmatimonadaceae bacterium]|nr:hypothetical protein [Gemmatimonadaceae bacterium]